jgi:hypothetical protein
MRKGCPLFPLLCNIVLEFLARAIRQEQEIKRIQIGNEDIKLSLFANDMIAYIRSCKNYPKLLESINSLGKVAGHKINVQVSITVVYTTMNRLRKKSGKEPHVQQPQTQSSTLD